MLKKTNVNLNVQDSYNVSYKLIPNTTYIIKQLEWSKYSSSKSSSESKISVEYSLCTNNLDRIEILTTDTSLYYRSNILDGIPLRTHPALMIPNLNLRNGPTICHSKNERQLIQSDSTMQSDMNSFNSSGIVAWNSQESLPNCILKIGESIEMENTELELYPDRRLSLWNVTTTTNYTLDSVSNNKCYLKFNSQSKGIDSIPKLIRHQYGTLEFDILNKYFSKIERYTINEPIKVMRSEKFIPIGSQVFPTQNIIEIRIKDE